MGTTWVPEQVKGWGSGPDEWAKFCEAMTMELLEEDISLLFKVVRKGSEQIYDIGGAKGDWSRAEAD